MMERQSILQLTTEISKITALLLAFLAGIQFTAAIFAPPSHAATAPKSCFVFDTTTGTITGYSNAASCPKDLEIPSSIDGIPVISLGQNAFAFDPADQKSFDLTSVTIPSSVTLIGQGAFMLNRLTTVTIPASVVTIEDDAFYSNRLSVVYIEGNPSLGYSVFRDNGGIDFSKTNDLEYGQEAEYIASNNDVVRIYATNPEFAAAHPHKFYSHTVAFPCKDGDCETYPNPPPYRSYAYITSAFIVNPISLTVNHHDASGVALSPSLTLTGINGTTPFSGYRLNNMPVDYSDPLNPSIDLTVFYLQGARVSPEVLRLNGYIPPSQRAITLTAGRNFLTYVYLTHEEVDTGTIFKADGNPGVPNTGVKKVVGSSVAVIFAGILGVTVVAVLYRLKYHQHK